MEKFKFNIEGQTFETSVEESESGKFLVTVNGVTYPIEMEDKGKKADKANRSDTISVSDSPSPTMPPTPNSNSSNSSKIDKTAGIGDGKKVVSPLPGSVIKILVTEGQQIKKGDTLITLESMKMENAIQSEFDGVVQKICVSSGQNIMQDDVLLIIS